MRIELDKDSYIEIRPQRGKVRLSIKARKDQQNIVLVTALLQEGELTSLISALVEAKIKSA